MSDVVIPGALPPPTLREQMDIVGPYGMALIAELHAQPEPDRVLPPVMAFDSEHMTCPTCGDHYAFDSGHECVTKAIVDDAIIEAVLGPSPKCRRCGRSLASHLVVMGGNLICPDYASTFAA